MRASSKTSILLAGLCLATMAASASTTMAMPMSAEHPASGASLLQQTGVGQHRVYPGSDSPEADKARAARNAPNLYCDKQEAKCD